MTFVGLMGPMNPWSTGGIAVHVEHVAQGVHRKNRVRVVTPGRTSETTRSGHVPVRVVRDFPVRPLPVLESVPELLAGAWFLHRADMLHVHDPRLSVIAQIIRKPLVTTFHGYLTRELLANSSRPPALAYRLYDAAVRKAVERSAATIAVDRRIASWLRDEYGADPVVIRNGVDVERFRPNGENGRLPLILVAKHFAKKCGVEYVVRAMPEVLRQVPDAVLVLTGPGGEEVNIMRLIRELELARSVFVHGKIPYERMPDMIAASSVCVVPSVPVAGVEEATSLFALEAMASGRPVVASAIGGLAEIIQDSSTGILVPPKEPGRLAAAIVDVLHRPAWAREIARNARRYVEVNHSWRSVVDRVLDVYAELTA